MRVHFASEQVLTARHGICNPELNDPVLLYVPGFPPYGTVLLCSKQGGRASVERARSRQQVYPLCQPASRVGPSFLCAEIQLEIHLLLLQAIGGDRAADLQRIQGRSRGRRRVDENPAALVARL